MPLHSISHYATETGFDFETVANRLKNLHCERPSEAPNAAKLYDSKVAYPILYGVDPENPGEKVTNQEASRRLTLARTEQVRVETEVKSGERMHRDTFEEVIRNCFGNIAAIIKQRADVMGKDAVSDALRELREACQKLSIASTQIE
jgi:hypothetical protein